jgi:Na+:H+ antiporter, NhaA family
VGELTRKPADEDLAAQELLQIEEHIENLEPPLNRFVHLLHPYVAFGVVPLFALANSGVALSGLSPSSLISAVPLGVMAGLFFGKQLGIFAFTLLAVKLGLSPMPGNAPLHHLYGVAMVAGIGFTVALFVAGLAFHDQPHVLDQAKLGILIGSLVSGVAGYLVLRLGSAVKA